MPRRLFATVLATALVLPAAPALAQSVDSLDKRLTLVERKLSSQALTEMVNELQRLRESVDQLRGDADLLKRRMDSLEERQRQMYSDLDERLRALETAGTGNGGEDEDAAGEPSAGDQAGTDRNGGTDGQGGDGDAAGSTGNGDGGGTTADAGGAGGGDSAQSGDRSTEEQLYNRAFETLRAGDYERAREQFRTLLERHPKGQYADNARYWLGESYYVVREFEQASEEFQQVLDDFPDSAKRPDALLKIGFIQYEQDALDKSRETLRRVISEHPDSAAAARAEQRLERIGG